ncbi:accessory factor UbiK family protein [Terrarubrum flagellatum]|uniref:accessory factor UbiK family protein n=1 Tax=Terrirubrum flagellatum TaxID=2895980 RepID=UPI003144F7A9
MRDTTNRILDDLAKLATEAAGAAQGFRRDAEGALKSGLERLLRDMNLVTREEFDAAREMAILAREENEKLEARIAALEARLSGGAPVDERRPDSGGR